MIIRKLKERFLGDERTLGALTEFKSLYTTADNPEAFHQALIEGDIEHAANFHPLSADELKNRFDSILTDGKGLAEDYSELLDHNDEEFIKA